MRKARVSSCGSPFVSPSYLTTSALIALCLAYWPMIAARTFPHFNALPIYMTASGKSPQTKPGLLGLSFEQRWNAIPLGSPEIRRDNGQGASSPSEKPINEIPFSCELAFSRLIKSGNFSTRCLAAADGPAKLAALK